MLEQYAGVALYEDAVDMKKVDEKRNIGYMAVKRVFDIFGALIGVIGMIILALPIKIMYMLTGDFKSIFYTHQRVGKNGKIFKMYKFRTMVPNSKQMLEEMLKDPKYKKEWDENQKFENDPRVTKAGKILRKTSLDELPQMLNPDCSLVMTTS